MGAPTFKEQIAADISTTFLNCLEFADTHTVNGKEMAAVVDDNELHGRTDGGHIQGPAPGLCGKG